MKLPLPTPVCRIFSLLFLAATISALGIQLAMAEHSNPGQGVFGELTRIARIDHQPINELSGLVKSKRYADVYWAHNDSGDSARLFALNRRGQIIFPSFLASRYYADKPKQGKQLWPGIPVHLAANIDWEDIAVDADYIYISDMGNNGNARRDQGIYMLFEPNPHATPEIRTLKFLPVQFPDQSEYPANAWHYDSEGLFIFQGRLYALTKHRKPGKINGLEPGADLYRLDTSFTDRPNTLVKVDSNASILAATGADLSPDGQRLAVLTYTGLWIFAKPPTGDNWLSQPYQVLKLDPYQTGQVEAVCWESDNSLLIANEQRGLYQVSFSYPAPGSIDSISPIH